MARVTSPNWRLKRKKMVKKAKGYFGRAKNCHRIATRMVEKGMEYAYRDRRNKKRDLRSLWIQRINAAARACGLEYSSLINKLKVANININRKMLSEIAAKNMDEFRAICQSLPQESSPQASSSQESDSLNNV